MTESTEKRGPSTRALLWTVGGLLAALLVAVIVGASVIVGTLNAQAEREAYQECLARFGHSADAPPPAGVDEDEYLSDLVDAAEACQR